MNSLLQVYTSSAIINALVNGFPYGKILSIAGFIALANILLWTMTQLMQAVYMDVKSTRLRNQVNREIYKRALETDYRYYDSAEFYADFTWAAQNLSSQIESARSIIENTVQNAAQFVAMATYIAVVGPWMLLVAFTSVLAGAYVNMKTNAHWIERFEEQLESDRRLRYFQRMFYTVEPAADLKSTRLRDFFLKGYDDAAEENAGVVLKFAFRLAKCQVLSVLLQNITFFVSVALIVKSVVSGDMANVAKYSALLTATTMLRNGLSNVMYQITSLQRVTKYMDRVRKFFDIKSEIETKHGVGLCPENKPLGIELRNVRFSYSQSEDEEKKYVIDGLSMKIEPGEKIAIVGENGAGKTTLMKLLLRLYDVNEGDIRIDGRSIKEYDVRKLRDAVGIAFQDSSVYSITVAENLRAYRDADDEKLSEILRKVGLSRLLEEEGGLSATMTHEFDDKGVVLSGGEMQKFALARLLTGSFGLLLLDEPTAALDPFAEYELNKLVLDRTRPETTIVIAHRLSTIRDADRIYLVEEGRILECGIHDELMRLGGKYAEMFKKQAEKYALETA
ncbi:MAG: ABC transporter ATP-binding protein [Clostridiales bacterium]|nr:ABC transporter ATP-binding protein [Clostridiales bacterium]